MRVAYFQSVKDSRPRVVNAPWQALARDLTTFRRAPGKRAAPCWSPACYRDGATSRRAVEVLAVSALVLDYDDGVSPAQALERWRGYAGVVHSSWSHRPGAPKCRVVLPLVDPVGVKHWRDVYRSAVAADGDAADPACCDASRIYLLPATGAHNCGVARVMHGARLDLAPYVNRARRRRQRRNARGARARGSCRRRRNSTPTGANWRAGLNAATIRRLRAARLARVAGNCPLGLACGAGLRVATT